MTLCKRNMHCEGMFTQRKKQEVLSTSGPSMNVKVCAVIGHAYMYISFKMMHTHGPVRPHQYNAVFYITMKNVRTECHSWLCLEIYTAGNFTTSRHFFLLLVYTLV